MFEERLAPGLRRISFLGHIASYGNDILYAHGSADLADVMSRDLAKLNWDSFLHLKHMPEGSPTLAPLGKLMPTKVHCVRLLIDADNVRDPEQRLSTSTRKTLRNKRNRLVRDHGMTLRLATKEELPQALEQLFALHHSRFSHRGRRESLLTGSHMRFLKQAAIERSRTNQCYVLQLLAGEKTISSELLMTHGRTSYLIQAGLDHEYHKYSPGWISTTEALRLSFQELGCDSCEFGPGFESYKFSWSPRMCTNYYACYGRPLSVGGLAGRVYDYVWRKGLPPSTPRDLSN